MGFDRLVSYATDLDKRRKSSDSNSPIHNRSTSHDHSPSRGLGGGASISLIPPPLPPHLPPPPPPHHHRPAATTVELVPPPSSASAPQHPVSLSSSGREAAHDYDAHISTLSMKFKGGCYRGGFGGGSSSRGTPPLISPPAGGGGGFSARPPSGGAGPPPPRVVTPSFGAHASSVAAAERIPTPGGGGERGSSSRGSGTATPASAGRRSQSPLPGENLPEHHPKKRYFAETREQFAPTSSSPHAPPPHRGFPSDPFPTCPPPISTASAQRYYLASSSENYRNSSLMHPQRATMQIMPQRPNAGH